MRARIFLLSGGALLIAAAFAIQACGATEETPAVTSDAGLDTGAADTAAKKDTAPPVEEDAATCDKNADFTKEIPDAAIGDSGSTSGLCLKCAKANCAKAINDCNQDCPCQGLAATAISCYLQNGLSLTCAPQGADSKTQQIGFTLLGCINGKCKNECATDTFNDAGADAGDGG